MKLYLILPFLLVGCTTLYKDGKPILQTSANIRNVRLISGDTAFQADEINHSNMVGTIFSGVVGGIGAAATFKTP